MPSLKGKILTVPEQHRWRINQQANDHKYTVETSDDSSWTPFNSNLHMQGIKVLVDEPIPTTATKGDAFEDTMMLLEFMKEQRMKANKEEKVNFDSYN